MRSVMSRSSALRWVANGRAAAPPCTVCSTGRLDLDEAGAVQHVADRAHDAGPLVHHATAVGVDDEVDVALADAQLGVGQPVVLVGQRPQRLAGEHPLARQHAELAATAADDLAGHADVVAEVDIGLPRREPVGADARRG